EEVSLLRKGGIDSQRADGDHAFALAGEVAAEAVGKVAPATGIFQRKVERGIRVAHKVDDPERGQLHAERQAAVQAGLVVQARVGEVVEVDELFVAAGTQSAGHHQRNDAAAGKEHARDVDNLRVCSALAH